MEQGNADAFFKKMIAEGQPAVATADSSEVFAERLKQVEREHAALQAIQLGLRQDEQRFQVLIQAERAKLESCAKAMSKVESRRAQLCEELMRLDAKAEELEKSKAAATTNIARLQAEAVAKRDEKLRAASTSLPSLGPSPLG
eukprot:4006108-Prymnesium_polylepis.1